jgi:riboflavin kinase/FMN adenylyltransferase
MKVVALTDAEPRARRVAVGTFDGVHLGHREVIRGADTVLTFDPHPLAVTRPKALPRLLDSFPVKRDLIASLGVDELVVATFDRELASRTSASAGEPRETPTCSWPIPSSRPAW